MNKQKDYHCHCGGEAPAVVTTQTVDGLKGLANAFVYVVSNNTTYYVSYCHEVTPISTGDVYAEGYDVAANPLGLRNQTLYDFAKNVAVHYNAKGEYRVSSLEEAA